MLTRALRKAAAVWVAPEGHAPRLTWTVWRGGALWIATGGSEPDLPGLADGVTCTVTVRSPTTHSHLVEFTARGHETDPDADTRAAMRAARRNGPDAWDRVHRLDPVWG